ncbi:MAG: LuxR C-terminal-related transcriptional regulator [Gemmatimonadaceae bacterium]
MAEGRSDVQIGAKLFISASTVDTYRRCINEKPAIADRSDYVRLAGESVLPTNDEVCGRMVMCLAELQLS